MASVTSARIMVVRGESSFWAMASACNLGAVCYRRDEERKKCNRAAVWLREVIAVAVSTFGRFVAILVEVLYRVLINEQIGAAETGQLDAVAIVPFHDAVQHFAIGEYHGDGRMRLHLLNVIETFREGLFRRSRFFPLAGVVRTSRWELLLFHFGQRGTE